MKSVIVAGGGGFIGSHVCKALSQNGFNPVVLDNFSTGYEAFVKWGAVVKASISDTAAVSQLIKDYNPVAALHFAAFINVGESVLNPARYYQNNVVNTLSFLDVLRQHKIDKIVFSSTAAVYGQPEQPIITEQHPKDPINPYGMGKWLIERAFQDYHSAYGTKSLCFRYFNAAGSDPDGEVGESHVPETHLIPLILDAAMGRRDDVKIFGTDYPTEDGTCIRDYIHVTDLADAHVKGLQYLLDGGDAIALNLGNGVGFSVKKVVKTVEQIVGRVPCIETERRLGDPPSLVASSELAKQVLGWTPAYPSLESIITHAWEWRKSLGE